MTWNTDGVLKKKADYYGYKKEGYYRTNEFDSAGNWRSATLPQALLNSDKQFNVPFDISPNKELLVAGIHPGKMGSLLIQPCKQFAIVDLKQNKILKTIDTKDNVESLAWAPGGKYFVVLHKQDVTEHVFKGPIDWLASSVGHPIGYTTFYLTVYQLDGTPLCTEQIAKKLPDAMSYIDWGNQLFTANENVKEDTDSAWVKYVKRECDPIGGKIGSYAIDARRKEQPVNAFVDTLAMEEESADLYSKEFTKNVTVKVYENVYADKNIQTSEQAAKEGIKICIESWLAFDPKGEKQATAVKNTH